MPFERFREIAIENKLLKDEVKKYRKIANGYQEQVQLQNDIINDLHNLNSRLEAENKSFRSKYLDGLIEDTK